MSIIKLHVCDLYKTDQIQDYRLNLYWSEWRYQEHYFNTKYIIHFRQYIPDTTKMVEGVLNTENCNTLLWIANDDKQLYRIKETPEQIMKLIGEKKNDK